MYTVTGRHYEGAELEEIAESGEGEGIYRQALASANTQINVRRFTCLLHSASSSHLGGSCLGILGRSS